MNLFVFPQIWDLADPEGKGFLDKQVFTRTHSKRRGLGQGPAGWVTSALPSLLAPLTSVTDAMSAAVRPSQWEGFILKIKVF